MRTDEPHDSTYRDGVPRPSRTVRYVLPAGLAEEVLREAQRQNLSPSTVATTILARGLPSFTTDGVLARIEAALRVTSRIGREGGAA